MESQYQHIIWDWNGTLLNDRWLCLESINTLLSERGKVLLSDQEYLKQFDFPVKDYYIRAGFDFSKEDFKIPALQFIDLYDAKRRECDLQKDAFEILSFLREQGVSQSVLSASESGMLNDMIDHFKLRDFFLSIKGLDNHYAASKIDLGIELINELNVSTDKILLIGDTCHDQEVAKAMGVDIFLFDKGHFPRYRLQNCGCKIIGELLELKDLFKSERNFANNN